ncbi:MAG: hypothetical protein V3R87_04030 [Dehalococcoidia bacterium]
MVEERPKRRRKKGKVRAKKAQPKKAVPKKAQPKSQPVLKEEQLPGLLEGEIPRGVPVAEEEAVGEEWPAVVAEREAVAEERPAVVAEREAVSTVAVEVAAPAREPEPAKGPGRRTVLTEKLMSVPEFRQRVVQLVVQKFS